MTQEEQKLNQDHAFKTFERMVSRQRFKRYRRETTSKQEAIALYLWNVALSEALYPPLQCFEVALRNATYHSIFALGDDARWFLDPGVLTEPRHQQQVIDAIGNIRRSGKGPLIGLETDADFPREPSRIVAELPLGFWVNLYSNPYTTTLVQAIVANAFPNGPKEVVTDKRQDVIYPRLSEILRLRNRVFHHEPIYHWTLATDGTSLKAHHTRLCEVVSWMCQVQPLFLKAVDRFTSVHDAGAKCYFDSAAFAIIQDEDKQTASS